MSKEIPSLELRPNYFGRERYLLKDITSFTYEDSVDAIAETVRAKTFKDQKHAIELGIVGVAGMFSGLTPRGEGFARGPIMSRFRVYESQIKLTSLRLPYAVVGYQTPDEQTPAPAFAVIDVGTYHNVVRQSEQELGLYETTIGHDVAVGLAN